MGQINPTIPTLGDPNATEDADIRSALITIRDVLNGNIDSDNLANAAVIAANIADNAIATAKYQDGSVTNPKLADNTISSDKLGLESFHDVASGDTTITGTSYQDITGISYTTTGTGVWLIWGTMDVSTGSSGFSVLRGTISIAGDDQEEKQMLCGDVINRATVSQFWVQNVAAGSVIKMRASKLIAGGVAIVSGDHSSLLGIRIS